MLPTFRRAFISCLIIGLSVLSAEVRGELRIAALRVSFQADDSPGTSGKGTFLLESANVCSVYTIDPPPHDRAYFESQIKAVDHYFRSVSHGKFGLDTDNSTVYPENDTASYWLANPMTYYHPYGADEQYDSLITVLLRDAVYAAYTRDSIDFSVYDLVVVFHAGIGQDFSLPFLDPTPEDIPSTYVDPDMIFNYFGSAGIKAGDQVIRDGVILPETQNHLFFDEAGDIFKQAGEPCDYQYGLTGTFALMIGFAMGLPPLWDTETGESGIGVFGLMDQGSNNGRGLIPSPPDAWSRIYAGWEQPRVVKPTESVRIPAIPVGTSVKIEIDDDEYYLVENRTNWIRKQINIDSLRYAVYEETKRYPPLVEILFDEVEVVKDPNGVVVGIPDYDLGLPASGLLIWHIDESAIQAGISDYTINRNRERRGIDLEEADGAQDIGYPSIFLFADPSSGYFGDMWFKGNPEYERANPDFGDAPEFSPYTFPDTRSNNGAASYLAIRDISLPGDTMTFVVTNTFLADGFPDTTLHLYFLEDFTGDHVPEIIGGGDSLWWSPTDTLVKHPFFLLPDQPYQLLTTNYDSSYKTLLYVSQQVDSVHVNAFNYSPDQSTFTLSWNRTLALDTLARVYGSREKDVVFVNSTDFGYMIDRDSVVAWSLSDDDSNNVKKTVRATFDYGDQIETTDGFLDNDGNVALFTGGQSPVWYQGQAVFTDIAPIDLDLDGKVEFLATTSSGDLYAFNSNLTLVTNFPVVSDLQPIILARNLFGDDFPEIVTQNREGEVLVFDWQGNQVYRFVNPRGSALRMVTDFRGRSAIVTESNIWLFDSVRVENGNEWPVKQGNTLNLRNMRVVLPDYPTPSTTLMNRKRTYAYPNPAKEGKVIIRVFVEAAEKIEIKIYDLAGYFVKDLVNRDLTQGEFNELAWDVSNIDSGVYFAIVTASKGLVSESKTLKIGIIH